MSGTGGEGSVVEEHEAPPRALVVAPEDYHSYMRWKASQERGVSTAEGTGPLQPEAQAGAAPNVVRADTSLRGSTGRGLGRQGDGAGRHHWPSSGTYDISSSLGMKTGLGFPIPRGPG